MLRTRGSSRSCGCESDRQNLEQHYEDGGVQIQSERDANGVMPKKKKAMDEKKKKKKK